MHNRDRTEGEAMTGNAGWWNTKRPLSDREVQVLALVAEGNTVQSTADALGTSFFTVQTQMQDILRKLGARNKAHAVYLGMTSGVIS